MDFNEQIGDILFRGFWQGGKSENGVVNPKARINKKAPVSYAEAQAFKYKLGALKPHIIVVDYDTDESFYAAVKIAQSKGEHFIAIKGAHKGGHLYYYNNTHSITKASNHNETALSLYPADYKLGCKKVKDEYKPSDSYAALSNDDGSDREVICFNPSDDGTLDEIPFYHRPIKSAAEHKFLGMGEGDGRNESLYTFMIDLKKSGFTYEEYLESVSLINEHLFSNPLPTDEFETVTRRSEWESIDAGDDKKTVSPASFMEFLRGKGIQIKYNEALNIVEYTGMDNLPGYRKVNDSANYNPVILQYAYRDYIHNKSISKQQTCDLIGLIADQNAYNPIKDYLTDGVWDGTDRFQAVFDFLQITDEFEQILVKKWFIQTAAMPFNTLDHSLQPEGVLILQGDEGIGKTRFFRLMTPNARWFSSLDKEMTTKNKDIVLEMLSAWIAEIGEFDRTTRANKSDLKNFMTQDKDTIRKPYAKEPLTKARTTSFCGTTNEERFLNSDTGSRRWWVIHLAAEKTFDFEHILNGVELHQFWLQCYHLFSENAASFRLTDEEKQITTENQSDDLPLDHTEKVEKYQKALEQKIISIIEKVSDATLKTLLHCRYIDFMKWDDVAVKIGCYPESIKQLHNTALDAVGDILAAEKATENNTNEALVEKIQSGVDVKKNMGLLYEQNKNFIYKCALPYSHRIEIEDLMQEAYFGLVKAVNGFDSSKGVKFLTYAIYQVRNALCNYYYKCGRTKRIPAHLIVKLSAYHHFVYDYESKNGEPPSDEQIQSHLNLSNTQYKALKKALTESTCSLEDVVPGTDLTVYDGVADEFDIEDTVLNPIANNQVNAEIWESVNGLSPRLKNVIELRYKNGLTQSDVAKELGVSGSRIAQCEHQAYKLLKTDARMRYAAEYYGYDSSITYFGGKAFYKQHGSSTEYIALNHIEAETKLKQINEYFENIDWAI